MEPARVHVQTMQNYNGATASNYNMAAMYSQSSNMVSIKYNEVRIFPHIYTTVATYISTLGYVNWEKKYTDIYIIARQLRA